MRHLTNVIFLCVTAFNIFSCASNRKLIEKTQTEFGSIKFYVVNTSSDKSNVDKIYADVDSNGIKRFYSFYPDKVVMTDERTKALSYTVTFQQLPEKYDSNIFHGFSRWDTLVFSKAKTFFETSGYSRLKALTGAKSYEIEVNYVHGFPKNEKFEPL